MMVTEESPLLQVTFLTDKIMFDVPVLITLFAFCVEIRKVILDHRETGINVNLIEISELWPRGEVQDSQVDLKVA
jgi:hypothetical protein